MVSLVVRKPFIYLLVRSYVLALSNGRRIYLHFHGKGTLPLTFVSLVSAVKPIIIIMSLFIKDNSAGQNEFAFVR